MMQRVAAVLLAAALTLPAHAQQDDLDSVLEAAKSREAIRETAAQAAAEAPKTDDKQELSAFYHKRGTANAQLGNYQHAIADLRLALENNQPKQPTQQGWGGRWRIQNDLGNNIESRGEWFAAIAYWTGIAQEYQKSNGYHYHLANLKLAEANVVLGYFARSDEVLKAANDTLSRLQRTRSWTDDQFNTLYLNSNWNAMFQSRQGNYAEAERLRRLALDYAEKDLELWNRQFAHQEQNIRIRIGNLTSAKLNLADLLASRGKYGEAEIYAQSGLEERLARVSFNTGWVSRALAVLGWTKFQQGNIAAAEKLYRYALDALAGSGVVPSSTGLSGRRAALGNAFIVQSRWQEALKAFEERDEGLRSDPEQFKRTGSRHVSWALALHKTGQSQQAAEMMERMIAGHLKRPVPNNYDLARFRGMLGAALAGVGKTNEALQAFQESVPELIRRDQDDVTSENSGYWRAFWRRTILESYLEVLAKVHTAGTAPSGMDVADVAFRMADLARDSYVQEAISASAARARIPEGELATLVRKDQDALNRSGALNQIVGRLASAREDQRLNKVIGDMRADIERLRKEHAALGAEIRKLFPEYAELIDPRPVGLADVRKALAAGEALVSIYLGDTQTYVWTIGGGGQSAFRIVPLARAEVEASVARLRGGVEFGGDSVEQLPRFDLGTAEKLYRTLFAPDAALWQDARILNVIPHGMLGQLPLALLVTAPAASQPEAGSPVSYRDVAWLTRKVAIAQLPSANAFVALRRAPAAKANRQPLAGFGDPLFSANTGAASRRSLVRSLVVAKAVDRTDETLKLAARGNRPVDDPPAAGPVPSLAAAFSLLSALPDTADELKEIATVLKADQARDIYLGRQASETNVKRAKLDDRRVVVFATHGIAPGELTGLDQPALALSNPALTGDKDEDGFLTMEEVLGLKLDADWVVLSACNTASADGRGSEAVSGLGRAFFFAGARSLLVSNWAVETTSARMLTTELFRRQSVNPALTRAEALRQSMLALMEKDALDAAGRTMFSYAHPAFWAPFSLVGDSGAHQ